MAAPQRMPQVQCRKSYTPTSQPWRARHNTGHQYQPLLLILSLRGIELYFLTQVSSEIRRDRQTPKVLASCKRLKGRDTAKWGPRRMQKNPRKKTTMSAGSGAEDQHLCMYSVTSNLLLSLNEPSSLFYLINWTVWRRKEKKHSERPLRGTIQRDHSQVEEH